MTPTTATRRSPFVYASSLAINVTTTRRIPEADTISSETGEVLKRISTQLATADVTLRDVIKTTCHLSDESYLEEFLEAYRAAFAPGPYPVTTTSILGLAGDCRVQIDVVAARPPARAAQA